MTDQNDKPDVYVMTTATFNLVRDHAMQDFSPATHFDLLTVYGAPIEHYPTLRDCYVRYFELLRERVWRQSRND